MVGIRGWLLKMDGVVVVMIKLLVLNRMVRLSYSVIVFCVGFWCEIINCLIMVMMMNSIFMVVIRCMFIVLGNIFNSVFSVVRLKMLIFKYI